VAGEAASVAADVPWAIGVPSGLKGVSRQAGWWAGPARHAFSGLGLLLLELLLGVVQHLLQLIAGHGHGDGGVLSLLLNGVLDRRGVPGLAELLQVPFV